MRNIDAEAMALKTDDLVYLLQCGLPFSRRPFAEIGEHVGLGEQEVITHLHSLFDSGRARRLGAVFDAWRIGYRTALCACRADEGEADDLAARIIHHAGMTHCYLRGWPAGLDRQSPSHPPAGIPNLWFTMTAPAEEFGRQIDDVACDVSPKRLLTLPALRRFKLEVMFGARRSSCAEESFTGDTEVPGDSLAPSFTFKERVLIKALHNLDYCSPEPYQQLARQLSTTQKRVIETLKRWHAAGMLKRVGLIVRHQLIGYKANGMCAWRVPDGQVERAGRQLASLPSVTHCYERATDKDFPYNLYAMIHATDWEKALREMAKASEKAGLNAGTALFSLKEYKKTSMKYFE